MKVIFLQPISNQAQHNTVPAYGPSQPGDHPGLDSFRHHLRPDCPLRNSFFTHPHSSFLSNHTCQGLIRSFFFFFLTPVTSIFFQCSAVLPFCRSALLRVAVADKHEIRLLINAAFCLQRLILLRAALSTFARLYIPN